ncbi:MAG TPA: HD domain-containing phosphohydrolase, partial [Vicinamibacterales bacterium]|nr:HD domain-containing phosphohydrolase [Vicinamibacterales bacterium]
MNAATPPVATLRTLPIAARLYVAAVLAAGVVCFAVAVSRLQLPQPVLFVVLLALAMATSTAKIVLPLGRSQSNLSLSHAVNFWALFSLGPAPTVCIATVSAWAQCTLRANGRNPVHRTMFSIASLTVTVACAGIPVSLFLGGGAAASLLRAAAIAAPIYFFVNTTLVAGAIALSTRQPVVTIWHRNFLWSAPSYLAGAALAAFATTATERGWFGWLALLAVPLYLVFRSYHSVVSRLRDEQEQTQHAMEVQLATIEALALAIEARAGCTPEHIRSIQNYAAMLAEAAGLSEAEVQGVRTAALLHDIGNMAVPEHILAKPEALTPEEFERVKIHPRVGADILRRVPFAAPVSELVLCHHERWDGLGYPAGMTGQDIPIGARILAIADCFSTLQTDRPYRPARSHAESLAILQEYAGTAFDPELVDLLLTRLRMTSPVTTIAPADEEREWTDAEPLALRDIAGAHREEQTLYEIAQALGSSLSVSDAMALIQEKVNRLVPFTTCALFLGDDEQGFVCRYAHGPGTEALLRWAPKSWSDLALRIPACADGRGPRGEDLASLLPCRLVFEGKLIGGLVIYHTVAGSFSDEHRRVLGRVSEQAAAVIYNSTRFEQSQHESHTDPLTGMPNRRSLDRQLEAGLAHAIRTGTRGSVVVLDLDRLKEINDTYGHEAGDRALRVVGNVLKQTVRQHDLCARFAGDEFIAVLWDCVPENEAKRVGDLQSAVAAHPFEPRPGVRMSLSISAGAARFPEDGATFEELLAAGDERMYRDKAGRRSRNSAGRYA